MAAVSTRYDAIFKEYAPWCPVAYARALAWQESRLNPKKWTKWKTGSGARGLFQVTEANLRDYNKAHKRDYTWNEMLEAIPNTRVWHWAMLRREKAFRESGIPALFPDMDREKRWRNLDWVRIMTASWNSGYSKKAGVQKVAAWLQHRGSAVTHENIFRFGREAGGVWALDNKNTRGAAKEKWQKDVAKLYAVMAALGPAGAGLVTPTVVPQAATKEPRTKGASWPWLLILALIAYAQSKR